jgi:hypothetical protein
MLALMCKTAAACSSVVYTLKSYFSSPLKKVSIHIACGHKNWNYLLSEIFEIEIGALHVIELLFHSISAPKGN